MRIITLTVQPTPLGYRVLSGADSFRCSFPKVGEILREFEVLHFARRAAELGKNFHLNVVADGVPSTESSDAERDAFNAQGGA